MIRGCLFDMDGVLLDTETMGCEILPKEAAKFGYVFPHELYLRICGCTHDKSSQILHEVFGGQFPYEEIMNGFYTSFLDAAEKGVIPVKRGAGACIEGLRRRGVKTALATSTSRDILKVYMKNIPVLRDAFDVIVCGGEVEHSKPAPDIYLEAARRLELSPCDCMGVEDSRNGLMSLRAAGCTTVMVPDLLPYDPIFAELVDHKLDDLTQLCGVVDRINLNARLR